MVDTEIFRYTPVGTEIFRYYNFSTHRCTLNYFTTAVSVHTGTHWNISVLQILYKVGILSFICELIHASYGLTLYMSLGQFHVYLLLKLLSCHETQDKSLTQACKDAISMLLIWNMHVFTSSCVWIKTEHFFLMVSMDLELLWICSCWMFCSPSFVLAFRAIRCHDKTPGKFIFLPPTSHVCFAGKNLEFTRLAEVVRLGGWWCCYWLILLLSAFVRPFSSRWTRATSLCAVNVLSSSFEFVVLVSLNVEVP